MTAPDVNLGNKQQSYDPNKLGAGDDISAGTNNMSVKAKLFTGNAPPIDAINPSGIQAPSMTINEKAVVLPPPVDVNDTTNAATGTASRPENWFPNVCFQLVLVTVMQAIINSQKQAVLTDAAQCVQDMQSEASVAKEQAASMISLAQLQSQDLINQGVMLIVGGAITLAGGMASFGMSAKRGTQDENGNWSGPTQAELQQASAVGKSLDGLGQIVQGMSKLIEAGYKVPEALQQGLQTLLETANKIRDKKWDNDARDWQANQQTIDDIIQQITQILKANSDSFTYRGGFTS